MTTAERLRAEGEAEGEGKLLLMFLADKFGPVPADVAEMIAVGDTSRMEAWFRRALTATSLDEVFGR